MIRIENISKIFNKGTATETSALQNISLHIKETDFVVVIGANGSGKSTLLNVLAGTALPDSGTVMVNEFEVTDLPDFKRSRYISRIFQNPMQGTAPDLSIIDNFRLAALRTKRKGLTVGTNRQFEKTVKEKISFLKMGLEDYIYKPMGSLSGGQRQALTLVMAIMDECKVLLLDEPTAALDPRSSALVMQKAREIILQHRLTAVLVTHHLKDVLQYGNRVVYLREGMMEKDMTNEEKQKLTLEELVNWFE